MKSPNAFLRCVYYLTFPLSAEFHFIETILISVTSDLHIANLCNLFSFLRNTNFSAPKKLCFPPHKPPLSCPQVMETLWFSSVLMSWLLLGHLYVLFFWSLMTWWITSGLYPGCHYCPFPYTQTTGNISSTPRTLVIWWLLIHKSRPSISFWLQA